MSNRWRYLNKDWGSEFTYPHGIFLYLNIQIMLWLIDLFIYFLSTNWNPMQPVNSMRGDCLSSLGSMLNVSENNKWGRCQTLCLCQNLTFNKTMMHSETLSYLYKTNYKIKMWLQRTLSLTSSSMSDFSTWQFSIFSATDISVHTKCCHGALIYNTKAHFFCYSFSEMYHLQFETAHRQS